MLFIALGFGQRDLMRMERAFDELTAKLFGSGPSLQIKSVFVDQHGLVNLPTLGVRSINNGHRGFRIGFPERAAC